MACSVQRVHPGGVLQQCGDKLRSVMLALEDIRRQPRIDQSGVFNFICPLELMCQDEPLITGWLIDPREWLSGKQDQLAIIDTFRKPSAAAQGWNRGNVRPPIIAESDCDVFEAEIAGLPGRGICFQPSSRGTTSIIVVVANREVGYLMAFHQPNTGWKDLREKMLTILPRFKLEIDTGDIGLLKWMQ
jgi:hypothetical protein